MHDIDREKATSIVKNLQLPDPSFIKDNPYFNKELLEDP
jgi:hypothetical protein